jgi:hypothetical protein
MSLSAFFDVCGHDVKGPGSFDFLINQKTVQEIEKEYPRVKFADEGAEVLKREFVEKPEYAKFSPSFSPFHFLIIFFRP